MNYHRQLKEFYEATVDAFDHHSLDRLVYFELTVRLKDVTNFGSNFKDVVFELITWAVSEGILEKLVMVIKAGCPDNPNLQVTANRLLEALPDGPPLLTLSLGSIANWLEEAGPLETQLAFDEFCNKIAIDAIPSSLFPPECSAKDRASALVNHLYHDGNYAAFLKLCNFIRKQVSAASNLKEILDTIAQEDVTENFRIAMRAAGWVDDSFILKAEGPPRPLRILPKFGITYPRRALDVGWRWGLQRGPFCGLISSPPDLSVLKHLREVERTLWDARQFDAKPSLPIRWWVQLDSTKKLSGSLSSDEFWRRVDEADRNAESFRNQELPTVPGLFFGGDSRPVDAAVIESWFDLIAHGRFPFSAPAIVVQFGRSEQARKDFKNLASRLRRIPGTNISIEAVTVPGWPTFRRDLAADESAFVMNRHKHEVGVAFCSWFGDIKKFAKRDAIKDELELSDARPLDDVYQRLHSTLNGQFVTPDAAAVVADFEQLCLPPNVEACFLRLVKLALRERLPQLIAAMAQASRRETRLIALRIAATNPILCDAWASGAAGGINGLQIDSLPSLPSPATEALALAFFRRLEVDEGTTKRAIDQMWRYLSDETRAVWKFLQHGATSAGQRTLLEKFGWRGLERAIDAGAELSADIQSMQRYGLDEPEFWWLLATMTPNARFLSDLLKLDARFRAIVGLCTDAEIQQLRQDTALWNAVCHCRRHVPLGTRTN